MKRTFNITLLILVLVGCTGNPQSLPPPTATIQAVAPIPTVEERAWNDYHPDPDQIWNRVFRLFYSRTASDGRKYGLGELDPLLWFDTTYLLNGVSHQQAIHILDEFLATHAENLINDPLKRAMFQRDLWAVFDWLAYQSSPYPSQRRALAIRIAKIMQRVALTKEQILSLPDNYELSVQAGAFPTDYQIDRPKAAFLPPDLFQTDSAWVAMGRRGGPIAVSHTEGFPFLGRSVFLVFVRSPGGRTATLDFIQALNRDSHPAFAVGSEVALIRRMLLIDDHGNLVLSPLLETIQIRHFSPEQSFHEFELDRSRLLRGDARTLNLNINLFPLFFSHGDVFEAAHGLEPQAAIPDLCKGCHLFIPGILDSGDMQNLLQSVISYSRANFPLPNDKRPVLFATTWEDEAQTVTQWKVAQPTWQLLRSVPSQ